MHTRLRDRIAFSATIVTLALVVGTVIGTNLHETPQPTLSPQSSLASALEVAQPAEDPKPVVAAAPRVAASPVTAPAGAWGTVAPTESDPASWEYRELANYTSPAETVVTETLATTEVAAPAAAQSNTSAKKKKSKKRVEIEHRVAAIPDPPAVGGSGEDRSVIIERPDRSDDPWAGVRRCESHNNYSINTGNGFYGAYQFTISTWDWVSQKIGRTDLIGVRPDLASPSDQDLLAQALAFEIDGGGLGHWPVCGRYYG